MAQRLASKGVGSKLVSVEDPCLGYQSRDRSTFRTVTLEGMGAMPEMLIQVLV